MKNIEPISTEIKAKGHTPQYRMHKYFARRPHNVFSGLIEHYTNEGDLVLDVFCGGGVTVFESLSLNRNSIGIDLNPVASFISKMQLFSGNYKALKKEFELFNNKIQDLYNDLYTIKFNDDMGIIEWIEWSYVVQCPECGGSIELTEKNKKRNGIYICPSKGCSNHEGVSRTKCSPLGSVPIRIKYLSTISDKKVVRDLCQSMKESVLNLEKSIILEKDLIYPNFKIPTNWDRQLEDKLLDKGIIEYKDFYSNRNFYILSHIFNYIFQNKDDYYFRDELFFLFSSSLRYCNKMSRVTENWENGNPTAMDKHAFWLPNQYIEANVIDVFKNRMKALLKGFKFSKEKLPDLFEEVDLSYYNKNFDNKKIVYSVVNASSSNIPINDKIIDVIITDPPYGSNVQYSELSVIWNAWYQLYFGKDSYIYKDEEAVSNRKKNFNGSKSEKDYENILTKVFTECHRVLKENGYLVFTFNNKNFNVWLAMLKSVTRSGFKLHSKGILFQDFVESYKNTSHLKYHGNIIGDFIYTFVKQDSSKTSNSYELPIEELIEKKIVQIILGIDNMQKITTTDIYKTIFLSITEYLSDYITYCFQSGIEDNLENTFEDNFIDKLLEKHLDFDGNHWVVKI